MEPALRTPLAQQPFQQSDIIHQPLFAIGGVEVLVFAVDAARTGKARLTQSSQAVAPVEKALAELDGLFHTGGSTPTSG